MTTHLGATVSLRPARPRLLTTRPTTPLVLLGAGATVSLRPARPPFLLARPTTALVVVPVAGPQGPLGPAGAEGPSGAPGPQGPPGVGTITSIQFILTSGGALGTGRLVVSYLGALVYADSTDPEQLQLPVYLTLSSANGPGQQVAVLPLGEQHDSTWTFTPDGVLYVGRGGHLTQTVPSAGAGDAYLRAVGQATAATTVYLNPGTAIRLD